MEVDPTPRVLCRTIDAVVWALRVSEQRGGPPPSDHLAELRLHMLRARRGPWRPGRRQEVDLAVAIVRSQLDGSDVAVPLQDRRATLRLLTDLLKMERALRHALPESLAA